MIKKVKVLVLDNLHEVGIDVFIKQGIQTDIKVKIDSSELKVIVDNYDGVVIRGATQITANVLENISRLKVIGRAGSGTDNIDKIAATRKGVVVMNTPGGNTITTAEHAIGLMFALARQLPQASASMKEGKWEKKNFIGTELTGKTLGIIGLGQIGKVVAERAIGLKMNVLGYDPYVSKRDILKIGIESVRLDDLYARSDFITYHTPLTPETKGIINNHTINKMKKGIHLINCARGALINEKDVLNALESGQIKGLALDVYQVEPPPPDTPLFKHPNVVLTPHLGAATVEAQKKVAALIAHQVCDFLKNGMIQNSVNFPSVSADLLPILRPYLALGETLGSFLGQLLEKPLIELQVEYLGEVSQLQISPITISVLKGLLQHQTEEINLVNARLVAEERGIKVTETRGMKADNYASLIRVTTFTDRGQQSVAGIIFGNQLKVVEVDYFPIVADLSKGILMLENYDVPGVVGSVGSFLGEKNINIGGYQLGRNAPGGTAISLINVDNVVPKEILSQLSELPNVTSAKYLIFEE